MSSELEQISKAIEILLKWDIGHYSRSYFEKMKMVEVSQRTKESTLAILTSASQELSSPRLAAQGYNAPISMYTGSLHTVARSTCNAFFIWYSICFSSVNTEDTFEVGSRALAEHGAGCPLISGVFIQIRSGTPNRDIR